MKKKRQILSALLFILAIVLFLIGAFILVYEKTGHFMGSTDTTDTSVSTVIETIPNFNKPVDSSDGKDVYEDDTESKTEISREPEPEPEPEPESEPESEPVELVENPYKDWFLKNSDMAAWLEIPDTIVDYPVMWTPEDEEHYLYLNFEGKKQRGGCLILDTDTCMDPLTTNLIIHGHNNKNQMFGDLSKYEKKSYRDKHPYIYLYGKDCKHVYEVMCVFRSQVFKKSDKVFKYYNFFDAKTEEEFDYFYSNIKKLQYYDSGVTAEYGDHFLTLSTCSYHVDMGRFVVVAKEIEPLEVYLPLE